MHLLFLPIWQQWAIQVLSLLGRGWGSHVHTDSLNCLCCLQAAWLTETASYQQEVVKWLFFSLGTWYKLISTRVNQKRLSEVSFLGRSPGLKVVLDPAFAHLQGKAHLSSQRGQAGARLEGACSRGNAADALEKWHLFGRRAVFTVMPFTTHLFWPIPLFVLAFAAACSME